MNPAFLLLSGALAYEGGMALSRFRQRRTVYDLAKARAKAVGRPLVVIGDPDAGLHTRIVRAYDCGDLCVDLGGCPRCSESLVADVHRLPFASDSAVVYVSCVLEYVENAPLAMSEVQRVAGSADNLFLVCVQPLSMTSVLYPSAKWSVQENGTMKPVSPVTRTAVVGSLLALAYGAVKR